MPADEHQGISDHADAAQKHGRYGQQGRQQTTHGHGDTDHIVGKGEEQILVDFFINRVGKYQKIDQLFGFCAHQGHIRHLLTQIRTGMNGQRKIGLYQSRSVIDAISDHRHPMVLFL